MSKQLRIKQIRSAIGRLENQKLTMRALGLRRLGATVVQDDTVAVRGMVARVKHLVEVEEVKGE
jgi:large subunit ribosomal protein L30